MLAWAQGQDNEAQLKNLSEKCADYHRKTEGESNGYRIKIHFGADKAKAREVKQKFSEKHRGIPAYEKYQQPNFVIVVGNFKTHIEAYTVFKQIQPDFPNAFIIKEKIKPIRD
ncbi:MAG: SPOR domain-containing protein [Bacteroidetes bacterium]|nr:SPOR domain-containing protein [Bacteroidota bacterium]